MGTINFNYSKDGGSTLGFMPEFLLSFEDWKDDHAEHYENDVYKSFDHWLDLEHGLKIESEELNNPETMKEYMKIWEKYVDIELDEWYEIDSRHLLEDTYRDIEETVSDMNQNLRAYEITLKPGCYEGFTVVIYDSEDGVSTGSDILDEKVEEVELELANKFLEKIKYEHGGEFVVSGGGKGHIIVPTEIDPEKLEIELKEISARLVTLTCI